jgi:hypothetical protein
MTDSISQRVVRAKTANRTSKVSNKLNVSEEIKQAFKSLSNAIKKIPDSAPDSAGNAGVAHHSGPKPATFNMRTDIDYGASDPTPKRRSRAPLRGHDPSYKPSAQARPPSKPPSRGSDAKSDNGLDRHKAASSLTNSKPFDMSSALPLVGEKRPAGDTRSADQILTETPELKKLPVNYKEALMARVGDYEADPDAAFRASKVIAFVTHTDANGREIKKNRKTDNGKIDGWLSSNKAGEINFKQNDQKTEIGRFNAFLKKGYDSFQDASGGTPKSTTVAKEGGAARTLVQKTTRKAAELLVQDAGGTAKDLGKAYYAGAEVAPSVSRQADKAATLLELQKLKDLYLAGVREFAVDDAGKGKKSKIETDFVTNLDSRIARLEKDPEVKSLFASNLTAAIRKVVDEDPDVKAEFNRRLKAASSPESLQAAFDSKDASGKPLSTSAATDKFIGDTLFYANALNANPHLDKTFQNATPQIKVLLNQDYFDVASGKRAEQAVASGTPLDKAIVQSNQDMAKYEMIMPKETVAKARANYEAFLNIKMIEQIPMAKIWKALGVTGVDDPKLREIIEKNLPTLMPNSTPATHNQDVRNIIGTMGSISKAFLGLGRIPGGLGKIPGVPAGIMGTPGASLQGANSYGTFHASTTILGAAALGVSIANGKNDPGYVAAQSVAIAGTATAGSHDFKAAVYKEMIRDATAVRASATTLEAQAAADINLIKLKSALNTMQWGGQIGQTTAGVGLIAGAVVGFIDGAKFLSKGNTFDAAMSFTSATGSAAIGGALVVNSAVFAAGRMGLSLGSELMSGLTGVAAGVAGIASGVLSLGVITATEIVHDIKRQNKEDSFDSDMSKKFAAVGIKDTPRIFDVSTHAKSDDNGS